MPKREEPKLYVTTHKVVMPAPKNLVVTIMVKDVRGVSHIFTSETMGPDDAHGLVTTLRKVAKVI